MRDFQPCVYILASGKRGYVYIGVTSNLTQRYWQHRERLIDGYSKQRNTNRLVWFEVHATMEAAIVREKRLKRWQREWKFALIETENPEWRDLGPELGFRE